MSGVKCSDLDDFFCETCQLGKAHRLPFKKTTDEKNWLPGEYIHTDVVGPMLETSLGRAKYFVMFTDKASSFRSIYFLKHKADVTENFKIFEKLVNNKVGYTIKRLHSDCGGEFVNQALKSIFVQKGIQFTSSAPYTPEQNGKSERSNRTIIESARSMMQAKDTPKFFWAEAVNMAVYLRYRIPCTTCPDNTPSEIWNGTKPNN